MFGPKSILTILVFALVAASQARAGDSLAVARTALAGPPSREWVRFSIVAWMGPGDRCEQGDVLLFRANTEVVIESCVAGIMRRTTVPWTLRENGALDPILSFGGKSYLVSFGMKAPPDS